MKKQNLYYVLLMLSVAIFSCKKNIEQAYVPQNDSITAISYKAQTIEELCKVYFNAAQQADAEKVINVTNGFLHRATDAKLGFNTKQPCHIQPIYAYGIEGIAYYEVWFTEDNQTAKGWALISATEKDYPLVNFSDGLPYSARLITENNSKQKVYRFGTSYYTLEENGVKTKEHGQQPKYIANTLSNKTSGNSFDSKNSKAAPITEAEMKEGVDYFSVTQYDDLKKLFPTYYFNAQRYSVAQKMTQKLFSNENSNKALRLDAYQYRWVPGYSAYYTQIPAYYGYNQNPCWSGCNNNAWANVYAWWDVNRSKTALIPTTAYGEASPLYRNTTDRQNSTDPVQMYVRSVSNTYCNNGGGWTLWSDCWKGSQYASAKGYGYTYQYRWSNAAGGHVDLANILTDGIANNYTPVIVGGNSHFYVALGWSQWDTNSDWTWAYCYPGWNEDNRDNVWVMWHDFNTSTKLFVY